MCCSVPPIWRCWRCAAAPILLALAARRNPQLDRPFRLGLAALLAGGWLCWYALFAARGWLTLGNGLPLNLCDWAALALIIALDQPQPVRL